MQRCYFTQAEAQNKVGQRIESIQSLPAAPVGASGKVVGIRNHGFDEWTLSVEWIKPNSGGMFLAMLGDLSFNISRRPRKTTRELSKDEFETAVRLMRSVV